MRFTMIAFLLGTAGLATAAEVDALAISKNIENRHLPHYTLLDPIFNSPTGDQIVSYTRCGDFDNVTGNTTAILTNASTSGAFFWPPVFSAAPSQP